MFLKINVFIVLILICFIICVTPMKYSFEEAVTIIKNNYVKPDDIQTNNPNFGSENIPISFQPFTEHETQAYNDKNINSYLFDKSKSQFAGNTQNASSKNTKLKFTKQGRFIHEGKDCDEVTDIKSTNISAKNTKKNKNNTQFNKKGQFKNIELPVEQKKKNVVKPIILWIFKTKDGLLGPYDELETKKFIEENIDVITHLKRNSDSCYVPINKIKNKNYFKDDVFDEIIEEVEEEILLNKKINEMKLKESQKNNEEIKKEKKEVEKRELTDEERKEKIEGCVRTRKYMDRIKCNLTLLELESNIRGLSFSKANIKVRKLTKLDVILVNEMLKLFLKEVKIKICSNVDEKGFISRIKRNK